jgi:TRAP-type C4-dicarboxylate transport system substrate-binding protein
MTVSTRTRSRLWKIATLFFAACLIWMLGALSKPVSAEPIVMKLGTATLSDQQYEWLKRFKASVERDSKGRIAVEIYPASQLGSIPREIEQTQFGAIQGWIGPTEFLVGVDPRYQAVSAPGVFSSPEQANRTYQDPEFRRVLLGFGADKGLKGLSLMYYGENSIATRKAVHALDDFKGMRIRDSGGDMQEAMMKAIGMVGLPMPLDQVMPAIQQGAIEGVLITLPAATPLKVYDAAKYFTEISVSTVTSIAVLNKSWFEKLPPDLQKVVADDGAAVGRDLFPFTISFTKQEADAWRAGGGEITRLSAADMQGIRTLEAPVPHSVVDGMPDVKQFFDLLVKTAQKYR